jgi:DNA polymerase III subunit epsilon
MKLLFLDIETTGLNFEEGARLTEVSWVLMTTPLFKMPPSIYQLFVNPGMPIPENITALTGITDELIAEYGMPPVHALEILRENIERHKPDAIVAHNGENFDKPFLMLEAKNHGVKLENLFNLPWIDTGADLPEGRFPTTKLTYMAAECGFLNPFPHSAVFDCLTTAKVLANCDIEAVLKRSQEPFVTARAMVAFDKKEEAKKLRFRWQEAGNKVYEKAWVKRVKQSDFETLKASAPFPVVIVD